MRLAVAVHLAAVGSSRRDDTDVTRYLAELSLCHGCLQGSHTPVFDDALRFLPANDEVLRLHVQETGLPPHFDAWPHQRLDPIFALHM